MAHTVLLWGQPSSFNVCMRPTQMTNEGIQPRKSKDTTSLLKQTVEPEWKTSAERVDKVERKYSGRREQNRLKPLPRPAQKMIAYLHNLCYSTFKTGPGTKEI
jgi:hypothetical protein